MEDRSDAELLATWRRGDQEAFAVLVARYHGLVRAACARQAASGDIDDCVQAVFLVLARRDSAASRSLSLAAWLHRVAGFVCRHARRAAERRRRAEQAAATAAASCAAGRPPEALGHLDECLQRLPERQRMAVVMHFLAGQGFEEVAASLGTSRNNASQLISRGLATLRSLLARRGVALGSAALAGLLAGDAQAAAAPATATIIATLTAATPTPAATTYASGAMTSMRIASATPFAIAAGLLLAAAMSTLALTAEPAPAPAVPSPPAAVTAPTPTPLPPVAWSLPDDPRLEKRMTLGTVQVSLDDYLGSVSHFTGVKVTAERCGQVSVGLHVREMRAADVLVWLAIQANARIEAHGADLRLVPSASPVAEPPAMASPDDAVVQKSMRQKCSFDFRDDTLADIAVFLRLTAHCNLILHPEVRGSVTLRVKDMAIGDALEWMVKCSGCRVVMRNGAIGILPAKLWAAPAASATASSGF